MLTEIFADKAQKLISEGSITEEQSQQLFKCLWDLSAVDLALLAHQAPDTFDRFLRDTVHQAFPQCDIEID